MEGESLWKCVLHKENSFLYCWTCKKVICSKCRECMKHNVSTIEALLDKYKDNYSPSCLEKYKKDVPSKLEDIKAQIEENKKNIKKCNYKIEETRGLIQNPEELKENTLSIISKTITYLRHQQEEASMSIMKKALQKSIDALDIQEKVKEKIQGCQKKLKNLEEGLEIIKNDSIMLE